MVLNKNLKFNYNYRLNNEKSGKGTLYTSSGDIYKGDV